MHIRTKDIMAALPLVASVLGDKYGVRVKVGGRDACTDGNTITLPTLPQDCDATLLAMARGFLDHEAAHIRESDIALWRGIKLTPLQDYLWNLLEDHRVEQKLASVFPGCRQNLRWLIRHQFDKEMEENGNPVLSILRWILRSVRSWEVPEISIRRDHEAEIVRKAFPGLLPKLESVLVRFRQRCRSTKEALGYALKLVSILEAYTKTAFPENTAGDEQPDSKQPGDGNETHGDGEKQEDGETEEDAGEPQGDGEAVDGAMPQDASAASGQGEDIVFQNETEQAGSTDSYVQQERSASSLLSTLLEAGAGELPKLMGEWLAKELSAQHTNPNTGVAAAVTGKSPLYPLGKAIKVKTLQDTVALRTRLHGLLQAKTQQSCIIGRKGKLYPQRLHALAAQNPRVFLKRGERRGVSTAVHLLLDASGSMCGSRMELAMRACYAVAVALGRCQGVNVGVSAFPAMTVPNSRGVGVAPVMRHGERVHDKFGLNANGNTPLAEAVWWALQTMYPLKEERKILCILSDGQPDSPSASRYALHHARRVGVEVMGLGIQDTSIADLLPTSSRVINDLADLAPAMFAMLQSALLHQEGGSA